MALYELAPDLPLYRVLPPPFRDWWCAKLEVLRAEREAEASLSAEAKKRRSDAKIAQVVEQVLLFAAAADDEAADAAEESALDRGPDGARRRPPSTGALCGALLPLCRFVRCLCFCATSP